MKHPNAKTADAVLVDDPDAAMRRLEQATRHILAQPKPPASRPATKKRSKSKH